ncbi:MAG TPA: TonB family protein [Steroidobacteraceae bacterium]
MLPQSEFESPMLANAAAPVAIAAITQDRALIGLLRSVIDPANDLILVTSEAELTPHLNSRRVSVALLDSMFIEGDLASMAERLRETWPDLVLVVVGTAEEQSKVAGQITSGVVYRFLHRPVSAPRVRLFVDAALRRHEVENVERTLEQTRPDFTRFEKAAKKTGAPSPIRAVLPGIIGAVVLIAAAGFWFARPGSRQEAAPEAVAQVDSPPADSAPADTASAEPVAQPAPPPRESEPQALAPEPVSAPVVAQAAPDESVSERLRPATSQPAVVQAPEELAPRVPPQPVLSFEQRLAEQLAHAESALQRGELASPPGRNAVELFRGALDLDPTNALAKGGLVRVADRLLSAAERAITAGSVEDAKKMVAVAESLTPATARGAFLMMQIEREQERAALTQAKNSDAQDKLAKGATYLRLAESRLASGALIEPSGDNARFYFEAARQLIPDDPGLRETERALQKQLLDRASTAADAGNAAETERWLANADGAGAPRAEMASIRRSMHDTLNGARASRVTTLTRSFTNALAANRLLQPADDNAKAHLLAMTNTDAGNPAVATARQSLGSALLGQGRDALTRGDLTAADTWLNEARSIGFSSDELKNAEAEIATAREKATQRTAATAVVGEKSLERLEYVAPKFPAATRNRGVSGWVELEFTVLADGSTSDVVVTNSNPRKTFDASAVTAVSQWRYKPVVRSNKVVEQRVAVRIRFSDQ